MRCEKDLCIGACEQRVSVDEYHSTHHRCVFDCIMMKTRRRGEAELSSALLEGEPSTSSNVEEQPENNNDSQGQPGNALHRCARAMLACAKQCLCAFRRHSISQVAPLPSTAALERLARLRELQRTPFAPEEVQEHADLLRSLGWAFFGALNTPDNARSDARWKELGFQADSPASDVRDGGELAIRCLLYMANHHSAAFRKLSHKEPAHKRKDPEYPFAAAGVTLVHSLSAAIGLSDSKQNSERGLEETLTPAGLALSQLLEDEPNAFEEAFVAAYERLDDDWLAGKATYMTFTRTVLPSVISRTANALKQQQPRSASALRRHLNLELNPADDENDRIHTGQQHQGEG